MTATTLHRAPWAVPVARAWNALLVAVIGTSLVVQIGLLLTGGQDANSGSAEQYVGVGTRFVRFFSYFTIESNLLVLACAITLLLKPDRDGRIWRIVRLDALLGIVITGLVFAIVLAKQVHLTGAAWWCTVGFHYVAPWVTLLGWLVLGPRPRITWSTVGWAFVWPVAWLVWTFAHGAVTDWYPYPFLNVAEKGYATALTNTGIVVVVSLVLAVAFRLLDRRLPAPGYERL